MFGPKSFYNICTESGLKSHWESKGSLGGSFMGTELFWICGGGYRNLYMWQNVIELWHTYIPKKVHVKAGEITNVEEKMYGHQGGRAGKVDELGDWD